MATGNEALGRALRHGWAAEHHTSALTTLRRVGRDGVERRIAVHVRTGKVEAFGGYRWPPRNP